MPRRTGLKHVAAARERLTTDTHAVPLVRMHSQYRAAHMPWDVLLLLLERGRSPLQSEAQQDNSFLKPPPKNSARLQASGESLPETQRGGSHTHTHSLAARTPRATRRAGVVA